MLGDRVARRKLYAGIKLKFLWVFQLCTFLYENLQRWTGTGREALAHRALRYFYNGLTLFKWVTAQRRVDPIETFLAPMGLVPTSNYAFVSLFWGSAVHEGFRTESVTVDAGVTIVKASHPTHGVLYFERTGVVHSAEEIERVRDLLGKYSTLTSPAAEQLAELARYPAIGLTEEYYWMAGGHICGKSGARPELRGADRGGPHLESCRVPRLRSGDGAKAAAKAGSSPHLKTPSAPKEKEMTDLGALKDMLLRSQTSFGIDEWGPSLLKQEPLMHEGKRVVRLWTHNIGGSYFWFDAETESLLCIGIFPTPRLPREEAP
jgi:hypothetical protein